MFDQNTSFHSLYSILSDLPEMDKKAWVILVGLIEKKTLRLNVIFSDTVEPFRGNRVNIKLKETDATEKVEQVIEAAEPTFPT